MARPKTVAILREVLLQKTESVVEALAEFVEKHKATEDPRMADVWERACETFLDRVGLVPPKEPVRDEEPAKAIGRTATPEELEAAAVAGEG